MSGAGARLPVVPTVTVLGMVKIRLVAAKKGHQLLKKKARRATPALVALASPAGIARRAASLPPHR
jgi:hypothetical protein